MARITYYISCKKSKYNAFGWKHAYTVPPTEMEYTLVQGQEGVYTHVGVEARRWLEAPTDEHDWLLVEVVYDEETGECY